MTLRLQFDDLIREVERIHEINAVEEDEFLKCAEDSKALKDQSEKLQVERQRLEKICQEKEKGLKMLKSELEIQRKKLEEEQKKSSEMEKERDALDTVLSEARKVILGYNNTSSSQLMSLLESLSTVSDQ